MSSLSGNYDLTSSILYQNRSDNSFPHAGEALSIIEVFGPVWTCINEAVGITESQRESLRWTFQCQARQLLQDRVLEDRHRGHEYSTHAGRASAWKKWQKCCDFVGIPPPHYLERAASPAQASEQENIIECFARFAIESGISPESAEAYISHVDMQHLLQRGHKLTVGLEARHSLKVTLQGTKKRFREKRRKGKRHFITSALIKRMKKALLGGLERGSRAYADACTLWAAFILSFEGLLRACEYTTNNRGEWIEGRHLSVADFFQSHEEYSSYGIYVKAAKTDQLGVRAQDPIYIYEAGTALVEMLRVRPPPPGKPLNAVPMFRHGNGEPITQNQLRKQLRVLLRVLGVREAGSYGLHAFRAGGATAMHQAGASDESIQRMGRWTSDAYRRYLRDHFTEAQRCLRSMLREVPAAQARATAEWRNSDAADALAAAVSWEDPTDRIDIGRGG